MATDKTPKHKRIKRAEEGRDDWKMKALLRREENEKLKLEVNSTKERLNYLYDENSRLQKELNDVNKKMAKLEKETEVLKKKLPTRG